MKKFRKVAPAVEVSFFNALKTRVLKQGIWGTPNVLPRTLALLEESFGSLAEAKKREISEILLYGWAKNLKPKDFIRMVTGKVFRPLLAIHQAMISLS